MHQALRHHAVERSRDLQVFLQVLLGVGGRLRGAAGLASRSHQRASRPPPAFPPASIRCPPPRPAVSEALRSRSNVLCDRRQLRLRLRALGLRGLNPGLCRGHCARISGALSSTNSSPFLTVLPAVHQHSLDESRHFGVHRHRLVRQKFAGQFHGPRDRLCRQLAPGSRFGSAPAKRQSQSSPDQFNAHHNIGSRDPRD